jgi:hypothetical protein
MTRDLYDEIWHDAEPVVECLVHARTSNLLNALQAVFKQLLTEGAFLIRADQSVV